MAVIAVTGVLVACNQQASKTESTTPQASTTKLAITTADNTKAVTVDQWADLYPDEYNSYMLNANDSETSSYLDANPFLSIIYEGTPFSKDYDVARGHAYALDDVQASGRISEKTKATCYACKGEWYPTQELVDKTGALYTTAFSDVDKSQLQVIGCYDCHLNNPASVVASRQFFNNAFPNAEIEWGASAAACGQCHNEYYFDPTTKAVMLPPGMTDATDILNYYNSIDFVDYTNPSTGTKQLKAQHPEVQMFAGSIHQKAGLTCADCHMERLVDENGNAYSSHEIVNPIESTVIQNDVCGRCHSDVTAQLQKVVEMSGAETDRETAVGYELEDLTNRLKDAVASGSYTEDELNQVRDLNRTAQWYWDFVFVENSNGYHNYEKCTEYLDLSEQNCQQAMALLSK